MNKEPNFCVRCEEQITVNSLAQFDSSRAKGICRFCEVELSRQKDIRREEARKLRTAEYDKQQKEL